MDPKNRQGIVVLLILVAIAAFVFYWRVGVEDTPGDYQVKKGNYRLEDGQYEKAVEEFTLALEKNPEHPRAHLGLAVTYMQMGDHDKSLEKFNRTIELAPDMAEAYADRGILNDRMGRYEEAIRDYKKALELNPKITKGPGWLWRFLRNVQEKPPTIADRIAYLERELQKPPEERLLRVPEIDEEQKMYKK
jgi:tetratricopeptide (TPR) repeat protein